MTILKFTFTCLILVAVHSIVFSQPVFNLDLESSIALAKEKSKTMLKLKQSLAGVGYDLRACLLYTSPSPRDGLLSRMPSSA